MSVTRTQCPFCAILARKADAILACSWPDAIAILPRSPVVPGHLLVLPRAHVVDALEDPAITGLVMLRAAELADPPCNLITSAGSEATQTVFHLHVHIVPRTAGDGLALPWTASRLVGAS